MIGMEGGEWEGLDGLGEDVLEAMKPKAEKVMWEAGARFAAELKTTLTGARTGRSYRVSKSGRPHVASRPGEPPAVLTGALRNSMGFSRPKWEGWTVGIEVGSGLGVGADGKKREVYDRLLEWGGIIQHPNGALIRILPRPYMAPTALKMEPIIDRLFEAGL